MSTGREASHTGGTWLAWAAAAVATLVVGVVAWRWTHPTPAPSPVAAASAPVAEPVAHPSMPALQDADMQVRSAVGNLSALTPWAEWLKASDLARRFVAAVNEVAEGDSPRRQLDFMAPSDRFQVEARDGHTFIADGSYKRFDLVADVVNSLDAKAAGTAWRTLHPLLSIAYGEIGAPGTTLDGQLAAALHRIEKVPVPDEPVEVVEHVATWRFARPDLESLAAADKHLLRMGPRNMRLIEAKATEIEEALSLPKMASVPPAGTQPPG